LATSLVTCLIRVWSMGIACTRLSSCTNASMAAFGTALQRRSLQAVCKQSSRGRCMSHVAPAGTPAGARRRPPARPHHNWLHAHLVHGSPVRQHGKAAFRMRADTISATQEGRNGAELLLRPVDSMGCWRL
jgi:hypothetical protein